MPRVKKVVRYMVGNKTYMKNSTARSHVPKRRTRYV